MNESMSVEDKDARDKGLLLVARLERLAQTNAEFRNWLQTGIDQVESDQWVLYGEDGWKER